MRATAPAGRLPPAIGSTSLTPDFLMEDSSFMGILNGGVNLNDAEFSWGKTQHTYTLGGDEEHVPPVKSTSKKGKNFSSHEDLMLCDAYLTITQDPIVGTEQKGSSYWKRVHDYFHTHIGRKSDRSQNSLQHRWAYINEHVGKFCAAMTQVERRNQSGSTQVDKMKNALIKYREDESNKAFGLMHCYEKLQGEEKWKNRVPNKKQKKTYHSTPSSSTPTTNTIRLDDEVTSPNKEASVTRPIGKKAAKVLRANGSSSTGDSTIMETLDNLFTSKR